MPRPKKTDEELRAANNARAARWRAAHPDKSKESNLKNWAQQLRKAGYIVIDPAPNEDPEKSE